MPAVLLALAVTLHGLLIQEHPVRQAWGDEPTYFNAAARLQPRGAVNLVPGQMPFLWQPPFAAAVQSLLIGEAGAAGGEVRTTSARHFVAWPDDPAIAEFLKRVSVLNLVLLALAGGFVYAICHLGGIGTLGASVAMAALVFHPRVAFYVQALWPEILHLALYLAGIAALMLARRLLAERFRAAAVLVLAGGIGFGYASLTKGVVGSFVWIAAVLLAYLAWTALAERPAHRQRTAVVVALFLLGFAAVVGPQKLANHRAHGSAAIASNFWINVELGLNFGREAPDDTYSRYFGAAADATARETRSRQRVVDRLAEVPAKERAAGILVKEYARITNPFLERGFERGRWAGAEAAPAALIVAASHWLDAVLLLLAAVGLFTAPRRDAGLLLVAVFALFYVAGLAAVAHNPRLFVQLIPALAILAGAAVDGIGRRQGA
ncbi:MAG: hypothetical protein QF893_04580 [Alphaproteobacteria bacterium]|nr:hypothetical protein [Alphaproteobacteria bacterium]